LFQLAGRVDSFKGMLGVRGNTLFFVAGRLGTENPPRYLAHNCGELDPELSKYSMEDNLTELDVLECNWIPEEGYNVEGGSVVLKINLPTEE
jgi:hypothetical protein